MTTYSASVVNLKTPRISGYVDQVDENTWFGVTIDNNRVKLERLDGLPVREGVFANVQDAYSGHVYELRIVK